MKTIKMALTSKRYQTDLCKCTSTNQSTHHIFNQSQDMLHKKIITEPYIEVSKSHPKNLAQVLQAKSISPAIQVYLYQQTGKHTVNILICLIYSGTNGRNMTAQSCPVKQVRKEFMSKQDPKAIFNKKNIS